MHAAVSRPLDRIVDRRRAERFDVLLPSHAELVHDGARRTILRTRERDDAVEPDDVERVRERRRRSLRPESPAPRRALERPKNLDVAELQRVEPALTDEARGRALEDRPHAESVLAPVRDEASHRALGALARDGVVPRSIAKPTRDVGIGVEPRVRIEIVDRERAHRQASGLGRASHRRRHRLTAVYTRRVTKRERIHATLARRPVDRPAVAFWRHVPHVDHTADGLARAMLDFHRRWDLDLVKVMSSGVYCVEDWGCKVAYTGSPNGAKQCTEHAVQSLTDWLRVKPLDPGAGALGRELDAVRLIARGRHDDAPILHTMFSPLTIARKLAGDRVVDDLRVGPTAVLSALEAITETMVRYVDAALDAGADGLFYATQTATAEVLTEDETDRFGVTFDQRVLDAARRRAAMTVLHLHGTRVFFDRLATLPVDAINWHDRLAPPSLGDAKQIFAGAVVGGLNEHATLQAGPPSAIEAEVDDAIVRTDGSGIIVAPGCVLPLATSDAHLEAVVAAVKRAL
jgi:uroporphyrinogen decarboxylase